MPKSKLEIGSFFILFMGMYTLVISILWIFLTEIMFVSDFAHFTGITFQEYLNNPTTVVFAQMYIITKKLIGVMLLGIAVLIIFINQKCYRKGVKWSWYALLIAGVIVWGTFISYKIFIGYIGASMATFAVGAGLFIVGIALPAKEIFSKNSS
ncbi:MAG: hypothetical protein ACFFCI_18275 [Promethearchaeota archaeon]